MRCTVVNFDHLIEGGRAVEQDSHWSREVAADDGTRRYMSPVAFNLQVTPESGEERLRRRYGRPRLVLTFPTGVCDTRRGNPNACSALQIRGDRFVREWNRAGDVVLLVISIHLRHWSYLLNLLAWCGRRILVLYFQLGWFPFFVPQYKGTLVV